MRILPPGRSVATTPTSGEPYRRLANRAGVSGGGTIAAFVVVATLSSCLNKESNSVISGESAGVWGSLGCEGWGVSALLCADPVPFPP